VEGGGTRKGGGFTVVDPAGTYINKIA